MPRPANNAGCFVHGCTNNFHGNGFCRKHYTRLQRGKNPFEKSKQEKSLAERFEEKYIRIPESGCWLWLASLNNQGYGHFNEKYAHRVSFEITNGPIPDGLIVRHKCDVSCCVNPDHLLIGTQKENMQDAVNRGRIAKGEKLPQYRHGKYSKYTEARTV